MGPGLTWPEVPEGFELWNGKQKAKWLTERWAIGAEAYTVCEGKRSGLIDWIDQ